jgi:hypothetical protein
MNPISSATTQRASAFVLTLPRDPKPERRTEW